MGQGIAGGIALAFAQRLGDGLERLDHVCPMIVVLIVGLVQGLLVLGQGIGYHLKDATQ